ncbi:MAG: phosphate ABC transporter substrate-binding protein [Pseudomonadota bacterium]
MMVRSRCFAFIFIGITTLLASGAWADGLDTFKDQSGVLKIAGGTAHIPVIKEAAERIMTLNPSIQISLAGGGSGAGIKQVGEGLIDIGNSGRKATDTEMATYGLKDYKWAIDGVAVIVNPSNGVKSLTRAQVADIYAGKITSWKELGGEDRAINIYTRDESSGTREVFWGKALEKGTISASAQFVVSNGAMKSAVAQDPHAIGYMSAGFVDSSVSPVTLDGVPPTAENIKNGTYPVARGLYSNTKGEATGLAKLLIDYLMSEEGQNLVADKGFIPVR